MNKVNQVLAILLVIIFSNNVAMAQKQDKSGADTISPTKGTDTAQNTAHEITDTGFINNNIRQQMLDIRLALLGASHANSPRVKQVARRIVGDGRENLSRLLTLTDGKNLPGLSQSEIDSVMGTAGDTGTLRTNDRAASATSGNTITDSLGSGSSGSGNVQGEDTGTLARAISPKNDANYSESGNAYAYINPGVLAEMDLNQPSEGKKFDAQWVQLMLKVHKDKAEKYSRAVAQVKDQQLKVVITQAIPKIRMHTSSLQRLSRNRDISEGQDNQKAGDDRNNRDANTR